MDFLNVLSGEGGPAHISPAVWSLVREGTDSLLLGPDWTKNIELCDLINRRERERDGSDALEAILIRLQNSDPKTVELSLILIETCMKNCSLSFSLFPSLITKKFMDEMINISSGKRGIRNQQEALRLIQNWGKIYENNETIPIFYDVYISLKNKGVIFPPLDPLILEEIKEKNRINIKNESSSLQSAIQSQSSQSSKLYQDMAIVLEKVNLCREILPISPGIAQDEVLSEVIGFLEACQERLKELIDIAGSGVVSEEDLETALRVYETVQKTLDAEKNGTPIPVEEDILRILSGTTSIATSSTVSASAKKPSKVKASLIEEEDDVFASLSLKTPQPAPSSTRPVVPILAPPPKAASSAFAPSSSGLLIPTAAPPPPLPTATSTSSKPLTKAPGGMTDDEFELFLNA